VSLHHACVSDIGCRRPRNEDARGFFVGPRPYTYLLVVADGVGGGPGGEVASRTAVDTAAQAFAAAADGSPETTVRRIIEAANQRVHSQAEMDPLLNGMATTCTAALVDGLEAWIGHVGDSRAYILRGDRLTQLTFDHSAAAHYERLGVPLPADRAVLANVLTRSVGTHAAVEVDVVPGVALAPGDTLLLCSDGLTKMVADGEIGKLVSAHPPDEACKRLVELARERGAPDNVTIEIARLSRG
jgi:protein phosphatase